MSYRSNAAASWCRKPTISRGSGTSASIPNRQRFYRSASAFIAAPAIGSPELPLKIVCKELLKRNLLTQVMAEPERVYSSVVIGYATSLVRIAA